MDTIVARPTEPSEPRGIAPKSGLKTLTPETSKEMPLEIYEKETGSKYISKVMECEGLLPDSVRDSLMQIDKYINQTIREKEYNPTTEAYRKVYKQILGDLGIDEMTSFNATVERIMKYMDAERLLKAIKDVDEEKILKQIQKSPTKSIIGLVMKQIEKRGL